MTNLTHGSLFTGILGFELGFEEAGFETAWCSEVDKFCNKIIATRRPEATNLGDVREIRRPAAVDVLTFGSPCQDLSVAGRRAGLDGARSGLFFEAARIINECRPAFAVWENVPGAFSSDAGRDFWMVLYTLRELGAHDVAWRVFDSQYAGVPQQRRRIYLVADFRGRRAGEILFESESCGGHPAPFGAPGQELAPTLAAGANRSGGDRWPDGDADTARGLQVVSKPLGSNATGGFRFDLDHDTYVVQDGTRAAHAVAAVGDVLTSSALLAHGGATGHIDLETETFVVQDAREGVDSKGQNGVGAPRSDTAYTLDTLATQAVAFQSRVARNGRGAPTEIARPLTAEAGNTGKGDSAQMIVFDPQQVTSKTNRGQGIKNRSGTLNGAGLMSVAHQSTIRRFTPLECERLQGFPDGWTCLCMPLEAWAADPGAAMFACRCADGPRYRALGNAVTANVPRWIASRMRAVL